MKSYSEEIITAFNEWANMSFEESDNETTKDYKNWERKSHEIGNKFENLCKTNRLNYLKVYQELLRHQLIFKIN